MKPKQLAGSILLLWILLAPLGSLSRLTLARYQGIHLLKNKFEVPTQSRHSLVPFITLPDDFSFLLSYLALPLTHLFTRRIASAFPWCH